MEITSIYSQFYSVLLRFIKSKVPNEQDAEDILQNVFIKIINKIHTISEEEKLQSWIYSITRNAITDYYRVNAKLKTTSLDDSYANLFPNDEYIDTTKGLECCMEGFINALPEKYRHIILDVEIKNIKQKDLVEKYNMAYSSIRSRVQRGREKIKEILLKCCDVKWDNRGNILETSAINTCYQSNGNSCKK